MAAFLFFSMDGDIYLLLLLLLLLIVPILYFTVNSLVKWHHISLLVRKFSRLNEKQVPNTLPYQFSWLDVFLPRCCPSNLLLFSSNDTIFRTRTQFSRNNPVYLTYSWQPGSLRQPSPRSLAPYYVVITDLQVAKQVLEDSDTWIKNSRQSTGVLASLMSLACTSMNDEVGKRQRAVLIEALKGVRHIQEALVDHTVKHLTAMLTTAISESESASASSSASESIHIRTSSAEIEAGWNPPVSSGSISSGTVDIVPAVSQASLFLLTRMVFGYSSSTIRPSSPDGVWHQGFTYDSLVQQFSEQFLGLWRLIRTNTLLLSPAQSRQRTQDLAVSVRTVKALLHELIARRAAILDNRLELLQGGDEKDRERQYCVLDGLLPFLKTPPTTSTATSDSVNGAQENNIKGGDDKKDDSMATGSRNKSENEFPKSRSTVVGSLSSDTKHMSLEELVHNLNNLLLAGFETSTHSLVVSLHRLAHCPPSVTSVFQGSTADAMSSDNPSIKREGGKAVVKALVRESLRLHPPVLQAARICRKETPLFLPSPLPGHTNSSSNASGSGDSDESASCRSGWMCQEGTAVIIDFVAIMRNPAVWSTIHCKSCIQRLVSSHNTESPFSASPDTFNLHRWLSATADGESGPCAQCEALIESRKQHWIPFGSGPKSCIGRGVALFATEGLLLRLLSRFSFAPPKSDKQMLRNVTAHSVSGLPPVDQTPTLRFTEGLQLHITVPPSDGE